MMSRTDALRSVIRALRTGQPVMHLIDAAEDEADALDRRPAAESKISQAMADIQRVADRDRLATQALVSVEQELDRARSEEARLLEESRKQAEEIERLRRLLGEAESQRANIAKVAEWREGQVKTLADALHGALKDIRGRMGHRLLAPDGEWCACDDCARRLAALRLAGRLK